MYKSDDRPSRGGTRRRARSTAVPRLSGGLSGRLSKGLYGLILLAVAPLAGAQTTVSITATDAVAGESPPNGAEFTVSRSGGGPFSTPTVEYEVGGTATNGEDYPALSGTVQFGIFQSDATITVGAPTDDGLFEGEETIVITLQENPGAGIAVGNGEATATISDSPHTVTVSGSSDASEDPPAAGQFVVALDGENQSGEALTVTYDVSGTATPGADYAALSGSVAIAVGSASATIDVTPVADDLLEDDETVTITLTGTSDDRAPLGDPAEGTLSIVDDDSVADDDGDGLSNSAECPGGSPCRDTDDDGLPDFQDADDDDDGIPTASENPPDQDTDEDGIPDYRDDDDDGDGRPTAAEDTNADGDGDPSTNPTDLDDDGIADYLDPDDQGGPTGDLDGDGLTNEREAELGTDRLLADTDGDGVNDGSEVDADTDPLDPHSFLDSDGDLVPDDVEAAEGTDPNDPDRFLDSDEGGAADHVETIAFATAGLAQGDVLDARDDPRDTDGDGLPDRLEILAGFAPDDSNDPSDNGAGDDSGNGITNGVESYLATLGIETVDGVSDFDRDGYPDAMEVAFGLDPLRPTAPDTDGDGVPNVVEAVAGLDLDGTTDSDMDGVPDAREIALGLDPLDANVPVANGNLDDDGDGVTNAVEEVLARLGAADDIAADTDTDGDGLADPEEIRAGTDPLRDEQPVPWIELRQAESGPVRALGSEGGPATATAVVGGHQGGTLLYDWSDSDNAILAVVSAGQTGRTLSFEPRTLPPGPYSLVVRVQRTVGNFSSAGSVVRFNFDVLPNAGRDDLLDSDQDGVPDASDSDDARAGHANTLPAGGGRQLRADPGVRLQLGSTARATQATTASVTLADIAAAGDGDGGSVGNSEDVFDYRGGIHDFEITNLPEAGAVVRIVIPQAAPIGEVPAMRKFLPNTGWRDFVEDDANAVDSASGSGGTCPAPGDSGWQPGLTPGHDCVRLTIEDAGPNDGDAADGPNGVIRDPGGVGTPKGEVVAGQGSGSADLLTLAVLAMTIAVVAMNRRRFSAMTGVSTVALLCLFVSVPRAHADAFVGVGAGLSSLDPDTAGTPFTVADDQDTGMKVFAGFDLTSISPHLSVEAFWADLGQATLQNQGTLDYSAYGAGLMFGLSGPAAPRFSAFVEAGIARLDISADIPFSQEEDTSVFFGLAGSYAVRRHWFLQLEYEYFAEDAQLLSLSIVKRFRGGGSSRAKTIPLPESRSEEGKDL